MGNKRKINEEFLNDFLKLTFIDSKGNEVNIDYGDEKVVLFISSLSCVHCIDLLPHLNEIRDLNINSTLVLFSDGSPEELSDMIEYFEWSFQVVSYKKGDLKEFLPDLILPFTIFLDNNKKLQNVATIYNKEDFRIAQLI